MPVVRLVNPEVTALPVSDQFAPLSVLTWSCAEARPANASLALARVKVGVVSLVILSFDTVPVSLPLSSVNVPGTGFTVSMVRFETDAVTAELPARSVTVARTE